MRKEIKIIRSSIHFIVLLVVFVLNMTGVLKAQEVDKGVVVVYTALDRQFSEPIFKKFEKETGISVLAKYDTESTKTVGLVNAIRAEKNRPRCDVFWNNEIVNTIRLKNEGLLSPLQIPGVENFPKKYRDPNDYWIGFAARARIILINTDMVFPEDEPKSIYDFLDPKWQGKCAIAKPLFGTTATHAACLFAYFGEEKAKDFYEKLRKNKIIIEAGNSQCAQKVSGGKIAMCMTDTDDAMVQLRANKPVKIIYPDSDQNQMGVLFIPNTLSIIKDAPHPQAARSLVEYLISPPVEIALARCPSAQIPLNRNIKEDLPIKTLSQVKSLDVNFDEAASVFESTGDFIKNIFLK